MFVVCISYVYRPWLMDDIRDDCREEVLCVCIHLSTQPVYSYRLYQAAHQEALETANSSNKQTFTHTHHTHTPHRRLPPSATTQHTCIYIHTQAAHQEALDTALKHERELQQLPALKRQLEALKHHATETELEMRCGCCNHLRLCISVCM